MSYLRVVMKRTLAATSRLAPLLRAGLIAGVVVAAVAYPLVAVGGLGAKAGADARQTACRTSSTWCPPAQTTYVYAADGKTLLTMFYEEHRKYTPIARHVAVHPAGDRGLRGHPVLRAQRRRRQGHRPRVRRQPAGRRRLPGRVDADHAVRPDGAARRRADPAARCIEATEQTTARKLREMRLAIELEKQVTKEEILERYLNSAYFGHRAYGIFAAAQVFFSKSPGQLTLAEAATLAGLVKAPSAYDPASADQAAATRPAQLRHRPDGRRWATSAPRTARRRPSRSRSSCKLTTPPNDCVSVPDEVQRLGLLLRLPQELVAASSRRSAATPAEREDDAAPRRLPGRHLARPEDPGGRR